MWRSSSDERIAPPRALRFRVRLSPAHDWIRGHRSEPADPARRRPRARCVRRPHEAGYLDGLNDEQRRAVEALDGPVLVLAGAGVGKTRVLTARIAHLISTGRARPHEILAVTFTNKAAREMRQRVARVLGSEQAMPWLGTFHSIGAKILRMHAELVGLEAEFHHPRHRRPAAPAEAAPPGGKSGRQALAGASPGQSHRRMEESRHRSEERAGERGCGVRRPARAPRSTKLSGPPESAQRGRFRRSPARAAAALARAQRHSGRSTGAASATSWSTSIRTPTSSSIFFSGSSPRPTATCAASATTISRSTPGAARTSKTSCASRRTFPARR